ncbi:hypothetical protein [Brevibacterium moorei]|uniref:hypothetical protein n=1 Tax=Brevibacterium moorei TaxID=2968457 RepID=UPI00211D0E63|nr:hypothetical protein [Brevibacterium sp. 68QC2CO]MCQ9385094.1 hypothetical protein [Brevibacterium sp. 68QC2CO]
MAVIDRSAIGAELEGDLYGLQLYLEKFGLKGPDLRASMASGWWIYDQAYAAGLFEETSLEDMSDGELADEARAIKIEQQRRIDKKQDRSDIANEK